MLNLFQDIDISILCEEVVESVFAGHVFQHSTAQSFDRVPNSSDKMSDARKFISSSDQMMGPQKMLSSGVAVILDVEPYNYHFITQPGALRRLIMNLLGNALKYTSHGYVNISLTAKENEDFQAPGVSSPGNENIPRSIICLTVRDTGKGISPEFLRSKLFMPFAQENSLSSGTGLGLSIVRKIVSLLEGEITIDSEVGRGTRKLPLYNRVFLCTNTSRGQSYASTSPRDAAENRFDKFFRHSTIHHNRHQRLRPVDSPASLVRHRVQSLAARLRSPGSRPSGSRNGYPPRTIHFEFPGTVVRYATRSTRSDVRHHNIE